MDDSAAERLAVLTSLVKGLVQDSAKVEVAEIGHQRGVIYEVSLSPADKGRLIGKQGKTIAALRTLFGAWCARAGKRCEVELKS